MSEEEIIKLQYEAIKRFSAGNKQVAYRVIAELAPVLREYIMSRRPQAVSLDELCGVIEQATKDWEINN